MYPQRMVRQTLRLGLLVTLVVLAVSACKGVEEYGPIVFGRHFAGERSDLTYSAIFAMNPDGSHVSQITHPPRAFATTFRSGPPMGRGSPSFARASRTLISSGLMRQDQVGNR